MKIGIVGSGSWGTALAFSMAKNQNNDITMWSRNADTVQNINENHKNSSCFNNVLLPSNITATLHLKEIILYDIIFIVIPVMSVESIVKKLSNLGLKNDTLFISCSKGIENNNLQFVSKIITGIVPNEVAVLSGPNLATEVIDSKYWFTNIGFSSTVNDNTKYFNKLSSIINSIFKYDNMNIEYVDNQELLEFYGAMKNVLALIIGFVKGLNCGENFVAAVFTMLLQEINFLSSHILNIAYKNEITNILSYGAIGDTVLTCYTRKSRNMNYGFELAQCNDFVSYTKQNKNLIEGLSTLRSIEKIINSNNINKCNISTIMLVIDIILHNVGDKNNFAQHILNNKRSKVYQSVAL